MFCEKFYGSKIPEMVMTEEEWLFLVQVVREVRAYNQAMERSRFREGIIRILNISRLGNQYMQACQPWQAIKGSDKDKWVNTICYNSIEYSEWNKDTTWECHSL